MYLFFYYYFLFLKQHQHRLLFPQIQVLLYYTVLNDYKKMFVAKAELKI